MRMKKKTTRREFLRQSLGTASAGTIALGTVPYILSGATPVRAEAPSDRLRMGCIGVGSMGRGDARDFNRLVDIVALCDVERRHLDGAVNDDQIGKKNADGQKSRIDAYDDYRNILDRKDIDIVSIVTTDPWHVKIAIEALQAGKHVFCQKPLTLTVEEGRLIRNAVRKYPNSVFQVGTQQRSQRDQFARACLMVRKGMLGEIRRMVVQIDGGDIGGPFRKTETPETLDFDRWLGPCPKVEYLKERVHYQYRWWYEYSGGKFTDWGAHHIDFVHWALGETKEGDGPVSFNPIFVQHPVQFRNGQPLADNCYNTSHKFEISCRFKSGVEMLVCSHTPDGNGIFIEGTKGRMHVNRQRIKGKPIEDKMYESLTEEDYSELFNGKPFDGWHKKNFISCIKERGLPVSDVVSHIQSMNSCHLCAIAARLGREIKYDPVMERISGDDQASTFLARERRKGFDIPVV